MTPLPGSLGSGEIVAWRLDRWQFRETWDSGQGALQSGGRWNNIGVRTLYSAIDPATAILEVAVHKGFKALDTVAHVLTSFTVLDPHDIHVVKPDDVPNPNWLRPGVPSAGQKAFGDDLLGRNMFVAIPSTVSTHSWNLIFDPGRVHGRYRMRAQERFALDPRLHPPT